MEEDEDGLGASVAYVRTLWKRKRRSVAEAIPYVLVQALDWISMASYNLNVVSWEGKYLTQGSCTSQH